MHENIGGHINTVTVTIEIQCSAALYFNGNCNSVNMPTYIFMQCINLKAG